MAKGRYYHWISQDEWKLVVFGKVARRSTLECNTLPSKVKVETGVMEINSDVIIISQNKAILVYRSLVVQNTLQIICAWQSINTFSTFFEDIQEILSLPTRERASSTYNMWKANGFLHAKVLFLSQTTITTTRWPCKLTFMPACML